jgi:hypothetical protein
MHRLTRLAAAASVAALLVITLAVTATSASAAPSVFQRPVEGVVTWKSRTSGCNGLKLTGTWTSQWVCVSRFDYARTGWMTYFRGLAR